MLLVCIIAASSIQAQTFSEQLNPTGDPIGGGPAYRDIKSAAEAAYVVTNKSALLHALSVATAGEIIYVDDAADLAKIVRQEKDSDFSYEHDFAVQRTVLQASALPV